MVLESDLESYPAGKGDITNNNNEGVKEGDNHGNARASNNTVSSTAANGSKKWAKDDGILISSNKAAANGNSTNSTVSSTAANGSKLGAKDDDILISSNKAAANGNSTNSTVSSTAANGSKLGAKDDDILISSNNAAANGNSTNNNANGDGGVDPLRPGRAWSLSVERDFDKNVFVVE